MKTILVLALTLFSLSSFASITCSGDKEGKRFSFELAKEGESFSGLIVKVDNQTYLSYASDEVHTSEHVYGTMVRGTARNEFGADGVLVLIDSMGDHLGWVSEYSRDFVVSGIPLKCN